MRRRNDETVGRNSVDIESSRFSEKQERNQQGSSRARRSAICLLLALSVTGLFYTLRPELDDASIDKNEQHHNHVRKRVDDDSCSIYMAPSSLKGNSGYGIFTTRDVTAGSRMLPGGLDGPSIPVVDYVRGRWIKTWNEYWWQRGVADHVSFEVNDGGKVMDYQLGFGSQPNHHCILNSLTHRWPNPPYDDSLVDRPKDPGTGAFSYSMGREFVARKDLKAGDEVFLNYGYCHRGDGKSHEWPNQIAMLEDYQEASRLCWAFLQLPANVNVEIKAPKGTNDLVAGLLPKSTSQLRDITKSTNIHGPEDLVPLLAKHVGSTPRAPEWIRSHGMCLDHLVARKSKLPHAGQGGFAQHPIKRGDIIVPAPLIHIEDGDVLKMYDDEGNQMGTQLLLNYCLGHPESSLLLCPETNALLINHCSNRKKQCGEKGPNAEFRWSSGWEPQSDEWRKMTIDEIASQQGRGLSMEVVAIRDIEPGEEVYYDYGVDFENAWEKHVKTWKPPPAINTTLPYVTAKEANEQKEPLTFLVTGDVRKISKHPYLFTGCRYWKTEQDKDEVWYEKNPSWPEWKDEEIFHNYADDGSQFQGDYATHRGGDHWPCTVVRQEEDGSYTVRIHQAEWEHEMKWHRYKLPRLLSNYPRASIHYFVRPYASDVFLPGVFRQPIGIPDDMFPDQWKNRKQGR